MFIYTYTLNIIIANIFLYNTSITKIMKVHEISVQSKLEGTSSDTSQCCNFQHS